MSSSQVTWSSGRQVIMASSHPVILSSCYLVFLLHVIWSSGHLVIQSSCHPVILCHLVIFVSTLLLTDRHTTSGSTGLLWRQLLIMTSSSTNTSILYFVDPCSLQRGRPCQLGAEEKIRLAGSPWQDCLYKGENCGQGAGGGEEARARAQPGAGGDEGAARGDPDTGDTAGHVTAILASHWSTPWVLRPDQRGSEAEHGAGLAAEDAERHHEDSGHLSGGRRPHQLLSCVSVITLLCINGLSWYRDGY